MTYYHWTFRPCTIEHLKRLTHEYEHCRTFTKKNCNDIFTKANCIQWTNIDTEITYLDILMLGICINGVCQAFSFAIFNKWSLSVAIINTLWGGILFLSVAFLYRNIIL